MSASVTIGEFSRLTHLTVKSLRHYHDQDLLTPYAIDPQSGYRRYAVDQAPTAMLIARLRALDMPLAEVRRVLQSADPGGRDAVIAEHLLRMERELDRTLGGRGLVARPAVPRDHAVHPRSHPAGAQRRGDHRARGPHRHRGLV